MREPQSIEVKRPEFVQDGIDKFDAFLLLLPWWGWGLGGLFITSFWLALRRTSSKSIGGPIYCLFYTVFAAGMALCMWQLVRFPLPSFNTSYKGFDLLILAALFFTGLALTLFYAAVKRAVVGRKQ